MFRWHSWLAHNTFNIGVTSSSLVRNTIFSEVWQSWSNAAVLKTAGRVNRPVGSNPTASAFIWVVV